MTLKNVLRVSGPILYPLFVYLLQPFLKTLTGKKNLTYIESSGLFSMKCSADIINMAYISLVGGACGKTVTCELCKHDVKGWGYFIYPKLYHSHLAFLPYKNYTQHTAAAALI